MNPFILAKEIEKLPRKQVDVGRFILRHGAEVPFMTVRALARQANVTGATVVRCCRSLGFSGYAGLQDCCRELFLFSADSVDQKLPAVSEISAGFQVALNSALRPEIESQVERITDTIFRSSCYVAGFRSAHSLAHYFAYLLRMVRQDIHLLPNSEIAAYDELSLMRDGQVLVIFSTYPYASPSIRIAQEAKQLGLQIIAVTDDLNSPLVSVASEALIVQQVALQFVPSRLSYYALIERIVELGCARQERKSRRQLKSFMADVQKHSGYWG